MTSAIRHAVVFLILSVGAAQARDELRPGEFQPLVEDGRTEIQNAEELLPLFDDMVSRVKSETSGLKKLENEELLALAADAAAANFYFPGSRSAAQVEVFQEIERRGVVTELQVGALHHTLVAARMWDDADALAKSYPDVDLEELPAHIDAGKDSDGLHVWDFDAATKTLVRRNFAHTGSLALVIISHPNCAFSRAAVRALGSDSRLTRELPEKRVFVAPTFGGLQLASISAWNAAQPDSRHVLVDRPLAWSFVRSWETPQFLFLVDGELVEQVVGWPDDAQVDVVIAAARRAKSAAEASRNAALPSR